MKRYLPLLGLLLAVGCSSDDKSSDQDQDEDEPTTITYTASQDDFPNPERGFYHYSDTRASNYSPLDADELATYRSLQTADGASYSVVSTLVFRYFILDMYTAAPLEESFLAKVQADFAAARDAGVKLIPRFTYTVTATPGDCPESFICPPYGDAAKATVLGHIGQLKPLLQDNADVIACVQLGFFGTWGENYYSDYFGDASGNDQGKLLDQNWTDRIEVLQAMLDATPRHIMVQVRYPQFKQRHTYGINALTNVAALTETEAFSETDKARIGYHNDCFLASADDFGTYEDYGNSSSPRTGANTVLRQYFADDSKYVVVGGETCSDGYSPQNDCAPAGKAEKEMSDLHYSYLNMDYNNEVNNDWVTGGCMDNIKKRLGYRFALTTGTYPTTLTEDDKIDIKLTIENSGFTSPFKARPAQLIFRNTTSGEIIVRTLATDVRRWFPGTNTIEESLEGGLKAGTWALYLNLPDAAATINKRPEYSIRLANNGTWDGATGYNSLNHTLAVK
ncbi:DUF4832 domain-containing protein [Dawidia soli]|uniref:DUF4832 domain-containing protein n=1 Tax=Dawidia soli TaxID=2782352 RepID=A0AAP2DF35_9BACT|nr:DUF4832 domain-containing protein [Dawidia soli]MBT1689545.1 DUF4832 domain-containing protein [Dawidia soli]